MSTLHNAFKEKLFECNRHKMKILIAKRQIKHVMPLKELQFSQLNEIQLSFIDQLVFRFAKLQDTIGEGILPGILKLSKENTKKKTFLDILNRMEELEVLDKNEWLELRETRNQIAHEYSFNTQELVEGINTIFHSSDRLIAIFDEISDFCKMKFGLEAS